MQDWKEAYFEQFTEVGFRLVLVMLAMLIVVLVILQSLLGPPTPVAQPAHSAQQGPAPHIALHFGC